MGMTVPEGVSGRLLRGGHTVFPQVERVGREGRRKHLRACFLLETWLCSQVGAYSKGLTWTEEWKGLAVTELILCL